ncbi:MAG TPA: MBL fold metallo-hydrolase [Terriglobales bacterium]|nr:MBL fold metallo-hydrolase [Terriglobales bacterium]
MRVQPFYLACLAHASYLLSDPASGLAAVVDPQRDVDLYLAAAAEQGLTIRYVFLTHFHADFIAGHLELRERAGAEICLGSRAKAEYAFRAMDDGEELAVGESRLRVLHTPGHTPESITLLVLAPGGQEPVAALTGDTLFAGDVGRPDLRAALGWPARALGEMLYDSLHQKLLSLPDATLVYPAHGAGSLCGKKISSDGVTTIGAQRALNYALQPMEREKFLDMVLADQPEAPAYFSLDAVLNTQERAGLEESLERTLHPLTVPAARAAQTEGAWVLDTRPPAEFAPAHWKGAINIPLDGSFATWCGTILPAERPLVVIAHPGREREAAVRLGRIGFDRIAGYLGAGMDALRSYPELLEGHARLTPPELAGRYLVDVRTPGERAQDFIPGSRHIPLSQLSARHGEIPRDEPIVVYCQSGYRSSIAVSLLASWGVPATDLEGGFHNYVNFHVENRPGG